MPHPPPLPLPFQTDLHRMRESIALRPFWAESILSNAAFGRSSISYDQPTLNDMIMNGWSERCILLGIFLTKYDICKILSINIYLSSAWSVNWWWSLVRFTNRLRFAFKDRLRQLEKSVQELFTIRTKNGIFQRWREDQWKSESAKLLIRARTLYIVQDPFHSPTKLQNRLFHKLHFLSSRSSIHIDCRLHRLLSLALDHRNIFIFAGGQSLLPRKL